MGQAGPSLRFPRRDKGWGRRVGRVEDDSIVRLVCNVEMPTSRWGAPMLWSVFLLVHEPADVSGCGG